MLEEVPHRDVQRRRQHAAVERSLWVKHVGLYVERNDAGVGFVGDRHPEEARQEERSEFMAAVAHGRLNQFPNLRPFHPSSSLFGRLLQRGLAEGTLGGKV